MTYTLVDVPITAMGCSTDVIFEERPYNNRPIRVIYKRKGYDYDIVEDNSREEARGTWRYCQQLLKADKKFKRENKSETIRSLIKTYKSSYGQ